jgi:hypothetical protein
MTTPPGGQEGGKALDLDAEASQQSRYFSPDYQKGYTQGVWDATQNLSKAMATLRNPSPILLDASSLDPAFLASLKAPLSLEGAREALDRLYALQSGLCQQHCGEAANRGIHTDGCRTCVHDLDTLSGALQSGHKEGEAG